MNTQKVLTRAMNPGPFLTLILLSHKAKSEDEGWQEVSSETAARAGATFCKTEDAAEPQSDQPAIVNLGQMIFEVRSPQRRCAWSDLALLTMLCRHTPRRDHPCWQGSTLPRGCVRVVRYASR